MEWKEEMGRGGKKPLVILTGPTAVGKTALSIGLAKAMGGEILSADSMQVYRGMDIGTAKITKEEMQGVPHHLIDILDPDQDFNVMLFQQYCTQCMEEIYQKGKLPIIVGGTGFYIQSVLYDIDFTQEAAEPAYRAELEDYARTHGKEALHSRLAQVDPESAESIPPGNVKRVIRALEYFRQTGEKISEHNKTQREKESPYDFVYYVLSLPRPVLYQRIEQRVDQMREQGLEEEVRHLQQTGCHRGMVSMQGLGYKEILSALDGEMSMEQAFEKIKQETRHFAKRQLTWFRRERDVTWLHKEEFEDEDVLLDHCQRELKQKFG